MPLQIEELLVPIAGDNPAGEHLRYDPVYNQIRQARVEEEALPTGGWDRERKTADHALVIKLSRELLSKRTKDLQIVAWLTEALLRREGFAGLRDGLELTRSLLVNFWEHLHPELEDGDAELRAAPLEWMGQYLDRTVRLVPIDVEGHDVAAYKDSRAVGYEEEATTYEKRGQREEAIQAGRLTAEEFDAAFAATPKAWYKQLVADIDGALQALDALDAEAQERFGSDAPRFSPMRTAIGEVRQVALALLARKLEREPDPVEEVAPEPLSDEGSVPDGGRGETEPARAPSGKTAVPSVFPAQTAAPVRGRAAAEAAIGAAARALRAESPTNPGPYLLLRGFRWGELCADGGDIDPLILAAPPTEIRTTLKTHLVEGRWTELLEAAEEVMAGPFGRGWLDLQRYVVTACDELGGDHANVAGAIRAALGALLQRHPELPFLALADDSPSANGETRAWLRSEGLLGEGEETSVKEDEIVPPRRRSGADPAEQAKDLVRAGKPEAAIELLMRAAEEERSARGRFLRRTQAAAILVDSGMEPVAMPILEELSEKIQQHSLEEWEEAETIAQTLGLLYRCTVAAEGQSSDAHSLYVRVCRLDPMQAMRFPPAGE